MGDDETLYPHVYLKSDGKIHKLQGGGPAMRDLDGNPIYVNNLIWCQDEEVKTRRVLTYQPVTCARCLDEYARQMGDVEGAA